MQFTVNPFTHRLDVIGVGSNVGATATSIVISFTNSDLVAGVATLTHNLNQQYVHVQVFDNNGVAVGFPDSIIASTVNTVSIDLTSFGALTGTWRVAITT